MHSASFTSVKHQLFINDNLPNNDADIRIKIQPKH